MINESGSTKKPLIEMNTATINKLLTSLDECTEWGQIFNLDNVSSYNSKNDSEDQAICENHTKAVSSHGNAAVVLSDVKVVMKYMAMMGKDTDFLTNISKKLSPPLVTLLSSKTEVQYVALRYTST